MKTINQIAQEYGVHPVQVGQWKKEILERAGTLFEGKRGPKAVNEYSESERLYGEIGKFTSESFTGALKAHDIAISMGGRGRALDNIFVERLWRSPSNTKTCI